MSTDLEKEIELAKDLKGKLDTIEGKQTKRSRKKEVSQDVVTPYDQVVDKSYVTQLDSTKKKVEEIEKSASAEEALANIPNPVKHKYISFVKSGFRITAGVALLMVPMEMWANVAGALLIVAEILGIAEEMV